MKELFDIIAVSGNHAEGFTLKDRVISLAFTAGLIVIAFLANII